MSQISTNPTSFLVEISDVIKKMRFSYYLDFYYVISKLFDVNKNHYKTSMSIEIGTENDGQEY